MQPLLQNNRPKLASQCRLRPPQVILHGRYFELALLRKLLDARH